MDPTTVTTTATEIVSQAGRESGWMAAALCLVGCVAIISLIVLVRRLMQSQAETETFLRKEMAAVIDDNTMAFHRFVSVLRTRACLRDSDVDHITGESSEPVDDSSLGETGKRVAARREARKKAANS